MYCQRGKGGDHRHCREGGRVVICIVVDHSEGGRAVICNVFDHNEGGRAAKGSVVDHNEGGRAATGSVFTMKEGGRYKALQHRGREGRDTPEIESFTGQLPY